MKNKSKGKQVVPTDMPSLNAGFSTELLGKALRSKRTSLGMRVDDIADRLGVSRITVMKIEKGNSAVTFSHILKYLDVVGLSLQLRDLASAPNLPFMDLIDSEYLEAKDTIPKKESWLDKYNQFQRDFYSLSASKDHAPMFYQCVSILQSNNSLELMAVKLKPCMLKLGLFVNKDFKKNFLDKITQASNDGNYDTIEYLVEFVLSDDFKEHNKGGVVNITEGWFGAK
ncbi:TPA: helix-turn-helix domain-containing protein [Photobacterium damselae]